MIVISGALVLVALVLLVVGLTMPELGPVYGSIAVSLIAVVFLAIGVLQRRAEQDASAGALGDDLTDGQAADGPTPPSQAPVHTHAVDLQHHTDDPSQHRDREADEADLQETFAPPRTEATIDEAHERGAETALIPAVIPGVVPAVIPVVPAVVAGVPLADPVQPPTRLEEPPVEQEDESVTDLVEEVGGYVLVVPGRLRYHVDGCRFIAGKEVDELDVLDALDEGFTPCGVCKPDAVLAAQALEDEQEQGDGVEDAQHRGPQWVPETTGDQGVEREVLVLEPQEHVTGLRAGLQTSPDTSPDTSPYPGPGADPDVERDADLDAGLDASLQAGADAGPEVAADAGPEVAADAGPEVAAGADPQTAADAGPDTALDPGVDADPSTAPDADPGPDAGPGTHPYTGPDDTAATQQRPARRNTTRTSLLDVEGASTGPTGAVAGLPTRRSGVAPAPRTEPVLEQTAQPSAELPPDATTTTLPSVEDGPVPLPPSRSGSKPRGSAKVSTSTGTGTRTVRRPATTPSARGTAATTVVVIPDRGKYHRPECRYVRGNADAVELTPAVASRQGFTACGVCTP